MKKILEKIKEYNKIIIHGHIRPDGDCIGSQYGLMHLIKTSFPEKEVYVTGATSEYISFIGKPNLIDEELFKDALSICLDCGSEDRLSDNRYKLSNYSIKIDHHFDSDNYTDYEYVDYKASSTTQIITEFYETFKDELIMTPICAKALYVGLLTDTGRFTNSNVDEKTFYIASKLVSFGIDLVEINNLLNIEEENTLRLKGYCLENFKITPNGFAYIVLKKDDLQKYNVDEETASSLVSSISNLENSLVWALILETKDNIRVRLRSKGPAINVLASKFNGGGHKMASGATLNNWKELDELIKLIDELIVNYNKVSIE